MKRLFFLYLGLLCLTFTSCAPYLHQPLQPRPARLGAETETTLAFADLPAPKDKIVAAVYKFRDQTGQYKPSATGTNWSTAVTQGATSILLRAIEESGWFIPIERENLSNLLNERKIIRSSRAEFMEDQNNNQNLLPPLLFAGIILEGGIISYDANIVTGGAGLRYFGSGGSGQYREDRVTIYLRAVSSSNGRILKTVYTTRTVLSQTVDVGVFRFVKFKHLLEAETGFTYNEPTEIAVKDAIEKAVYSLIAEGIVEGLWAPENPEAMRGEALSNYLKEREMNQSIDYLGRHFADRRSRLSLGPMAGTFIYNGDYSDPLLRPMLGLQVAWNTDTRLAYGLRLMVGETGSEHLFTTNLGLAEGYAMYRFYPRERYTPFVQVSGGVIGASRERNFDAIRNNLYAHAGAGLGFEYLITDRIGLQGMGHYHYLISDKFDELKHGKLNDAIWNLNLGVNIYF
jgi:curli production assembly/transport component CsgG